MKTASILDLPMGNELDIDLMGEAMRRYVERLDFELTHGRRVVISSNPFSPDLEFPVTVLEPKP